VNHYMLTRSLESLASMLVELEDSSKCQAEFGVTDDWPEAVRHMKVAARKTL